MQTTNKLATHPNLPAKKHKATELCIASLALTAAMFVAPSTASAQFSHCVEFPQSSSCQGHGDSEGLQAYQVLQVRFGLDILNIIQSTTVGLRNRGSGKRSTVAGVDQTATGLAAGAGGERWNGWVAAAHGNMDHSFLRASGYANVALGGADYTFDNDIILGVASTIERSRTDSLGTRIKGAGYSFAPYVAVPLNANWLLDASFGFGRTDVDSITGAFVATAKDRRTFESLSITYGTDMGKWQLQGKASYLGSKDKFNTTPSTTSKLNQVRIGGQATYDAGSVLPYVGVTFIRDVSTPPPIFGSANDRDAIQLQAGVNIYSKGPLSGGLSYSYEANRKEIRNNVFVANLSYRF